MDNNFFFGLPAGFGLALTANQSALNGYTQMTEAEKERIILQCKDARSDREVNEIIGQIVTGNLRGEIGEIRDQIK